MIDVALDCDAPPCTGLHKFRVCGKNTDVCDFSDDFTLQLPGGTFFPTMSPCADAGAVRTRRRSRPCRPCLPIRRRCRRRPPRRRSRRTCPRPSRRRCVAGADGHTVPDAGAVAAADERADARAVARAFAGADVGPDLAAVAHADAAAVARAHGGAVGHTDDGRALARAHVHSDAHALDGGPVAGADAYPSPAPTPWPSPAPTETPTSEPLALSDDGGPVAGADALPVAGADALALAGAHGDAHERALALSDDGGPVAGADALPVAGADAVSVAGAHGDAREHALALSDDGRALAAFSSTDARAHDGRALAGAVGDADARADADAVARAADGPPASKPPPSRRPARRPARRRSRPQSRRRCRRPRPPSRRRGFRRRCRRSRRQPVAGPHFPTHARADDAALAAPDAEALAGALAQAHAVSDDGGPLRRCIRRPRPRRARQPVPTQLPSPLPTSAAPTPRPTPVPTTAAPSLEPTPLPSMIPTPSPTRGHSGVDAPAVGESAADDGRALAGAVLRADAAPVFTPTPSPTDGRAGVVARRPSVSPVPTTAVPCRGRRLYRPPRRRANPSGMPTPRPSTPRRPRCRRLGRAHGRADGPAVPSGGRPHVQRHHGRGRGSRRAALHPRRGRVDEHVGHELQRRSTALAHSCLHDCGRGRVEGGMAPTRHRRDVSYGAVFRRPKSWSSSWSRSLEQEGDEAAAASRPRTRMTSTKR